MGFTSCRDAPWNNFKLGHYKWMPPRLKQLLPKLVRMEPNQDRSIVPQPSRELAAPSIGANRILGEMVESSLAVANVATREAELDALVKEARRLQAIGKSSMSPEFVRAFELFHNAAQAGHAEAQYEVGFCFAFGEGVGCNHVESARWTRLAAEQGLAEAQHKMGNPFNNDGKFSEAAEWYRKAAEQGHSPSQRMLCSYYSYGKGVPQDDCQAYAWAQLAADAADDPESTLNGAFGTDFAWCQREATAIAALLSPVEMERARGLYLEFKRKYSAKR